MESISITFEQKFSDEDIHIVKTTLKGSTWKHIDEVMQELVKPTLIAAGFHENLVSKYIKEI